MEWIFNYVNYDLGEVGGGAESDEVIYARELGRCV